MPWSLPLLDQVSPGKPFEQSFQPRHPISEIGYIPSNVVNLLFQLLPDVG